MAEVTKSPEAGAGIQADVFLEQRQALQDKRLRKWGKWMVGGTAGAIAGVGLLFVVPWIGFTVATVGSAVAGIGVLGTFGNVIRGRPKK